jgi:hypothetical protein
MEKNYQLLDLVVDPNFEKAMPDLNQEDWTATAKTTYG